MLLVYKCLNGQAPLYLSELLEDKSTTSRPGLQSTCDGTLLCIPFTKRKTFADRSFSIAGPKLWNCLTKTIRESPNTDSFKKHLKTLSNSISLEQNQFFLGTQAFASPTDMASSGVWENIHLSKTATLDGVCGILSFIIILNICQIFFVSLALITGHQTTRQ